MAMCGTNEKWHIEDDEKKTVLLIKMNGGIVCGVMNHSQQFGTACGKKNSSVAVRLSVFDVMDFAQGLERIIWRQKKKNQRHV